MANVSFRRDPKDPKGVIMRDENGQEQKVAFRNKREDYIYDVVRLPVGAIGAGTRLELFRDVQNKFEVDMNIGASRKLRAGTWFEARYAGVYFPLAQGNTITVLDDVKKVMDAGFITVQVNGVDLIRGKIPFFPLGLGMTGCTTRTDTDIFSMGVPATASVKPLDVPQWIESSQDLTGSIEFQARAWDVAIAMPTLATQVHIFVMLKGIMWS